jgi:hypothetical protein
VKIPTLKSVAEKDTAAPNFKRRRIYLIQSVHMKKCVSRSKTFFFCLKGWSPLKKCLIGGNVEELKAYRLIPLKPPFSLACLQYHLSMTKSVSMRIPTGWSMSSAALICCKHIARKVTTARRLAPWNHKKNFSSLFKH